MGADRGQRRDGLAGKEEAKDLDVALLSRRESLGEALRRGERLAHGGEVARELEGARLADMGERELRIGRDGAVEGSRGTGVDGQEQIDAVGVGIARGGIRGGECKAVAVGQHWVLSRRSPRRRR
jgi:hypothetical protein